MLSDYLSAAMRHAHYEILADEGTIYGEIALCPGVYANASSLEECREELAATLEDWLLFRIHRHLDLPEVDGLKLAVTEELSA